MSYHHYHRYQHHHHNDNHHCTQHSKKMKQTNIFTEKAKRTVREYESCHIGLNDKQALSLKRTNKEYVYCRLLGRLLSKLLRSKKGKWKIKNSVILKLSMKEVAVTNKENYIANTSALEH